MGNPMRMLNNDAVPVLSLILAFGASCVIGGHGYNFGVSFGAGMIIWASIGLIHIGISTIFACFFED